MALTRVDFQKTAGTTSAAQTTASMTWQAGDLFIAMVGNDNANGVPTSPPVPTFSGGTFTAISGGPYGNTSTNSYGHYFQCTVAGSGSGGVTDIAETSPGTRNHIIFVWQFRGHNGIGGHTGSADTNLTLSNVNTGTNSWVCMMIDDWSASASGRTGTPTVTNEVDDEVIGVTDYSLWGGDWSGQSGTVSYGVTGGGGTLTKMVVEVLEAGGAPAGISKVADRGTHAALDAATTSTLTLTNPTLITVGNYLLLRVAADNVGASGAATTLAITDPRSNPWTISAASNVDPGAASAGCTTWIAYARVNTAYQAADALTFTWGAAIGANSEVLEEWTGIHKTTPVAVTPTAQQQAAGATLATPITGTPTAVGQLFYAAIGWEGIAGDTYVEDTDTTGGSWVTLTTTASANATRTNNTRIAGAYKLVTSTAAQSWTPTGITASTDMAALAYVFNVDPGPAPVSALRHRDVRQAVTRGSFY